MNRQPQHFNTPSLCCTLLLGPGLLVIGAMSGSSLLMAADAPSWPCYQGPNGNFSASECNLTLVDELAQAKLLWKSEEPTPVGAGQSKRYGGHGWHTISLGNYKAVTIPLADGGTVTSGGGIPLPSGGSASPVMADGRLFVSYFVPTGEVVDAGEQTKRDKGPGTWTPDYWKVDAHDVILAIDPATGKTLWKQVFANKGINWQDHKSCMTGHAPCTYNGRVYAIGSTCRVYCVEAATGKPVWEADLGAEHQRIEEHKKKGMETKAANFGVNRGHCNSSAFAAGVLVCPDYQGGLIGFDGVSGKKLWSLTACIGKYGTPTRWVTKDGESLLIGNAKGEVRCLDPLTGKERWQVLAGPSDNIITISGDVMLVNNGKDPIEMGDANLVGRASAWKMTLSAATKIWEHTAEDKVGFIGGGMNGVPILGGKALIRTKAGSTLVEIQTGKILARCPEAKVDQESLAYAAEGRFFHEPDSQHGIIHDVLMLGFSPETFKPMGKPWNTPHYDATGYEMPISHPVVEGRLYLRGADGVYCWDLRKN